MAHFLFELFVRGILLSLLTALLLLLFRRMAAAYRHLMCVPALCGLLALPLVQRSMPPLLLLTPQPASTPGPEAPPTQSGNRLAAGTIGIGMPPLQGAPERHHVQGIQTTIPPPDNARPMPAPILASHLPDTSPMRPWDTGRLIVVIWGLGGVSLFLRLAGSLFRLRRLQAGCRPARIGKVPILVGEHIATPLTWE